MRFHPKRTLVVEQILARGQLFLRPPLLIEVDKLIKFINGIESELGTV